MIKLRLIPWLAILGCLLFMTPMIAGGQEDLTLFDFGKLEDRKIWEWMSDQISGGNTTGRMQLTENGSALYSGQLDPRDSYPFCLFYSTPDNFQLRAYGGLLLRLKGDGNHYRICLYTGSDIGGISYQAGFTTRKGRLMNLFLPFSSFIPFLNQRVVRQWPVLDLSSIKRLAIMISGKSSVPFQLEVFSIKAKSH